MKILQTNTRTLIVSQNTDGTLYITKANGKPIANPGAFIMSIGGINAVLERCKEYTEEEFKEQRKKEIEEAKAKAARVEERLRAKALIYEKAYKDVFNGVDVVKSTRQNISILLHYLNTNNIGLWNLPKMTIGYRCNQYDCGGEHVTTIILNKPIYCNGCKEFRFKVGGSVNYLCKYSFIDRC